MKRFPKILAATCAAVILSSSLALAAEPLAKDAPAPAPFRAGPHGVHGADGPMGHAMGPLAQLSPEKQEAARKLMDAHAKAMFPLHQSLYAKHVEMEALNAAGEGESGKARSVVRDIADLNSKMLIENNKFRTRMFKETGLRTPVMGHGPMGMGGKGMCGPMMGGKMGGQMGGHMAGTMSGMMGGMTGGAPAPAPSAPDAPEASAHDGHGN